MLVYALPQAYQPTHPTLNSVHTAARICVKYLPSRPQFPNSPKLHKHQDFQPPLYINSLQRSDSRKLKEPRNPHQLATIVENQTPFPRSKLKATFDAGRSISGISFSRLRLPETSYVIINPRENLRPLFPCLFCRGSMLPIGGKKTKKRNEESFLHFQPFPPIIQRDGQLTMGCLLR